MEQSLYDPAAGFYPRRESKGDFYTAPELHPAFGAVLAAELAARLAAVRRARPETPLCVVEMGSGDGTLSGQLRASLRAEHPRWAGEARWILVERVENLLLKSVQALRASGGEILGHASLENIPGPVCGVFLSNELVDALPVHLLEKSGGEMREVFVRDPDGTPGPQLGPLSDPELRPDAEAVAAELPEGGRHAVSLEARRWLRRVAGLLDAGSILTVDYGDRFLPGRPNPPRSFRGHRVSGDLFQAPGRTDLTASVDFSALIREGERCGLRTAAFLTLGRFLMDRGILERMPQDGSRASFKERAQLKTLFHPDGMGDRFKVLIQEKGLP